jgi:nucleoside-diphosphate-sugar epimerase
MRVLLAGCSDIGTALGVELAPAGHEVWGLRRRPEGLPAPTRPIRADLTRPETLAVLPRVLEVVVYTAAPAESTDRVYRAPYVEGLSTLLEALTAQQPMPHRRVLASGTALYGQPDGAWVDETSPTEPRDSRGRHLLEAERLLAALPGPATVRRLGGICVPGRTRLVDRLRRGEAARVEGSPRYGNRIHRDDCVGALRHVVELARPASFHVAVDHEPAEECEVLRGLASQLGLPAPPIVPTGAASRRSNKRYRFRHPTLRDGYAAELRGLARRADPTTARHPRGHGGSERERER